MSDSMHTDSKTSNNLLMGMLPVRLGKKLLSLPSESCHVDVKVDKFVALILCSQYLEMQ